MLEGNFRIARRVLKKIDFKHFCLLRSDQTLKPGSKSPWGQRLQRVFKKHSLKKIFAKRAGLDKSMSMMEYSKLLRDTKTIDGKSFSHKNVEVFNNVQDEGNGGKNENEMMESELDYAEFIESLAAIAAYKYPDPYTDTRRKIHTHVYFSRSEKVRQDLKFVKTHRVLYCNFAQIRNAVVWLFLCTTFVDSLFLDTIIEKR